MNLLKLARLIIFCFHVFIPFVFFLPFIIVSFSFHFPSFHHHFHYFYFQRLQLHHLLSFTPYYLPPSSFLPSMTLQPSHTRTFNFHQYFFHFTMLSSINYLSTIPQFDTFNILNLIFFFLFLDIRPSLFILFLSSLSASISPSQTLAW